jgi:hypothetical protein
MVCCRTCGDRRIQSGVLSTGSYRTRSSLNAGCRRTAAASHHDRDIDIRLSTLPALHGESLVLRCWTTGGATPSAHLTLGSRRKSVGVVVAGWSQFRIAARHRSRRREATYAVRRCERST